MLSLPTARARNRKENESSQRSVSYQYFLNKRNEQVRVCKTLFCSTLGVSVRTISAWIESDVKSPNNSDGSLTENQNKNLRRKKNLRFDKEKESLKAKHFIIHYLNWNLIIAEKQHPNCTLNHILGQKLNSTNFTKTIGALKIK